MRFTRRLARKAKPASGAIRPSKNSGGGFAFERDDVEDAQAAQFRRAS